MLDDSELRHLLLATARQDVRAYERLYRATAPLLLGVAMRLVTRRELAEEVLHDSFVKIWQRAGSFDAVAARPMAWLVAIVRHHALDLLASADQARVHTLGDDAEAVFESAWAALPSAESCAQEGERTRVVRHCIERLQGQERQVLVLAYHHGLSHSELAGVLGRPLGTVKTWARKALAQLGACVQDCLGETP